MAELPELSETFRDFLIAAKAHGYASESVDRLTLASGATETKYQDGGWLYVDSYAGGSPFIGFEHVSVRHPEDAKTWLPIWAMHYQGDITHDRLTSQKLAELLAIVLTKPDPDIPVRGPSVHYFDGSWGKQSEWGRYELRGTGGLERFQLKEFIGKNIQHAVYRATFAGGLINRDPELERLRPVWLA